MFGLSSPRFDSLRSTRPGSHRNQRGFVMSSPLALMSAGAVLLAGVGYVVTSPTEKVQLTLAADPQPVEPQTSFDRVRALPAIHRQDIFVVVFNNSGITGLAGKTAEKLTGAGWNVVGSDNWYGTIPASTVYYPASLAREAKALAKDLDLERVKPAVDPMQMDRLTVILTPDYR